jgi:hypothetical protein
MNFSVAVGRQSAMHTEHSGFASPTLGQHISTFRGYRILFSYIIDHNPSWKENQRQKKREFWPKSFVF